jgi:hypothetical protein
MMKIRCSFLLLAILTQYTSLCLLPAEVKAVNDIIIHEKEKTELTIEEKEKIFNDVQQEVSHYGITLNHKHIINDNSLSLQDKLSQKTAKEQQNILAQISAFTWLNKLWLDHNNLTSLPDTLFNLTKLTQLFLNDNELKSISDTIGNLINLDKLYLNDNKLTSIPKTIGNLTNLKTLGLDSNKLSFIPETISNLINLTRLSLHKNKITFLPDTIGNLTKLLELFINRNELISIPASIQNIPNLIIFNLFTNPHLLPNSDNPLQWGKTQLRTHFGNRVYLDNPSMKLMPNSTTKEEVYEALDKNHLRINRDVFIANKLPDIQVEKVFEGEEMLQVLAQIVTSMNFSNDKEAGYLSYEMLANDFASDAKNQNLSNVKKVWQYLMPRLTGYIRTLYNLPLEGNDVEAWKMYPAQIPETQKALTFIMERIKNTIDPDTKMLLFNLLVNGLLHCPTGQAEGINAVAYALLEGVYKTNNFKDNLKSFLAIKKNASFTTAILAKAAENSQNVHLISSYRDQLKEDLGLTSAIASYQERMGSIGENPFAGNKWNVVQVFYDLVSPNRLIDWMMQASETKQDREDANSELMIGSQKLLPEDREKEVNRLRSKTRENKQFRPFTTGAIAEYLYTQKLISYDDNWKKYFTANPVMDGFAILTRDGAKAILIHEGFLIKDSENEQIIIDKNIISD